MDLSSTIDDDRKTIARIVAGLFALLGLIAGQSASVAPQRIARGVHRAVAAVLRPAESAVRRLVYLVSLTIAPKSAPVRPMPADIVRAAERKARSCFRLFDPRLRLVRRAKAVRAQPRISFFGDGEVRTLDLARAPKDVANDVAHDGLIDGAKILRRLEALKSALEDLPRQARRLKRALQRRSKFPLLKLQGPLRPGYPPGHRARRLHEIDDVLRRCHWRAREALPDTS